VYLLGVQLAVGGFIWGGAIVLDAHPKLRPLAHAVLAVAVIGVAAWDLTTHAAEWLVLDVPALAYFAYKWSGRHSDGLERMRGRSSGGRRLGR
jgi:hypothetical protein